MAISRSGRPLDQWIAGAHVFSGRPDPTWTPDARAVRELQQVWKTLQPWRGSASTPPSLGYRGTFLRAPDGREWMAYRTRVVLTIDDRVEDRLDPNRSFEQLLLGSAPQGALPPIA